VIDQEGGYRFQPSDRVIAWCPPLPSDSPWRHELPSWFRPIHDPTDFLEAAREALSSIPKKCVLTVDIETAGKEATAPIRIVNLHFRTSGSMEDPVDPKHETTVILPLRWRSGAIIDPVPGFHEYTKEILKSTLRRAWKLAFQNGTFDTHHLIREGFMISRSRGWLDTMIAHRASKWGENRHNLAAIMADLADEIGDMELHKDQFLHGGEEKER